jgi:hypothetical protein
MSLPAGLTIDNLGQRINDNPNFFASSDREGSWLKVQSMTIPGFLAHVFIDTRRWKIYLQQELDNPLSEISQSIRDERYASYDEVGNVLDDMLQKYKEMCWQLKANGHKRAAVHYWMQPHTERFIRQREAELQALKTTSQFHSLAIV